MSFPQGQPQAPAQAQPSSKKRGCLIAAAVVALLCFCCCSGFAYMVWTDEDVQRMVGIVGAGLELVDEAQNGPGTAELRQAGCGTALVLTPELLQRIVDAADPDGTDPDISGDIPDFPMVICNLAEGATLSCESAAQIYGTAVASAYPEFMVQVQPTHGGGVTCSGIYTPTGQRLRDLDPNQSGRFDDFGQAPGAPPTTPAPTADPPPK